jgi:hypothetical protein
MSVKRKKTTEPPYQRNDAPLISAHRKEFEISKQFAVHQKRCDADPIYRMLLFADDMIEMDDGTSVRYIDVLLGSARVLMEKMYGKYFHNSPLIQQMFALFASQHDTNIKIFAMSFILAHEPAIAKCFSDMYDTTSRETLFEGQRGPQQFFLWNQYFVKPAMGLHKNHHNNKYTIVMEMEQYVLQAVREYAMGPFDAPKVTTTNKKQR